MVGALHTAKQCGIYGLRWMHTAPLLPQLVWQRFSHLQERDRTCLASAAFAPAEVTCTEAPDEQSLLVSKRTPITSAATAPDGLRTRR